MICCKLSEATNNLFYRIFSNLFTLPKSHATVYSQYRLKRTTMCNKIFAPVCDIVKIFAPVRDIVKKRYVLI